jgi:hypothetical protein
MITLFSPEEKTKCVACFISTRSEVAVPYTHVISQLFSIFYELKSVVVVAAWVRFSWIYLDFEEMLRALV